MVNRRVVGGLPLWLGRLVGLAVGKAVNRKAVSGLPLWLGGSVSGLTVRLGGSVSKALL